ncbi:hypothetical protein HOG21_06725 [bacterium]|nr:hypothetical protein [bacterium]
MKKIILSVLLIFLFSFEITLAKTVEITNIKINHTINKEKSIEEIFNFLAENQKIKIPKSYKHIQVQYKDVIK